MNPEHIYEESDYDEQEAKSIGCALAFWCSVIVVIALAVALYILL